MQTSDIRWLLGALFIAFLVVVALSDFVKRRRSSHRHGRSAGFRSVRSRGGVHRTGGWKTK